MTSPSRRKRPTTRPSTSPARAAEAYRSVDRATRTAAAPGEALWLPAGWLAAVLMLTAAAPALGAAGDGWRARGAVTPAMAVEPASSRDPRFGEWSNTPRRDAAVRRVSDGWSSAIPAVIRPAVIRPVGFDEDIAGPRLRVASRPRRVAQNGDALRDALTRPFGEGTADDADTADRLFDEPTPADEAAQGFDRDSYQRDAASDVGSLFDQDDGTEEVAPGDPMEPASESGDLGGDFGGYQGDYADNGLAEELATPYGAEERAAIERDRLEARKACGEQREELRNSPLATIDLFIGVTGDEGTDYPYYCRLDEGSVLAPRCWADITYLWKASGLCHKPLYFEDVHLERYGHSWGPYVQPLVSGAHFFGRLPVLPYMMGLKTPTECVYTLGHYRPGSCAPYLIDPIPFTWRAALFQAGGTVGVAGFLP